MKIGDILKEELILARLVGANKSSVLEEMTTHLHRHAGALVQSADQILAALVTREKLGSTGVGEGVAIPHAKIAGLKTLTACFGRHAEGFDYDAVDARPVNLVFMLLVPENSAGVHLKALARISRLLKNTKFREQLLQLDDQASLFRAFVEEDTKHQPALP